MEAEVTESWSVAFAVESRVRNLKSSTFIQHAAWFALLVGYFVIAVAFYMPVEGWGLVDCLYFGVLVVTTVGYGDYVPSTDASKIFTAFFAMFAMVVVAVSISHIFNAIKARIDEAILHEKRIGVLDIAKTADVRRRRFFISFAMFVLLLIVGTVCFATVHDWPEKRGNAFANGFYVSVITLTTVGFGDFTAGSNKEKFFDMAFMMVGVPVFGAALSTFSHWIFGSSSDKTDLKVVKNLDTYSFYKLEHFCTEMKQLGLTSDDTKANKFEFLCFLLCQNKVIDMSTIKQAMENFGEFDVHCTGKITLGSNNRIGSLTTDEPSGLALHTEMTAFVANREITEGETVMIQPA